MGTATSTFTVVPNTVSQSDLSPSVGVNTGGNGFQYPTYVPVQVPAPVPSKTARITNVSLPSIVLPNATFNIIVSFASYITTVKDFAVHLTIPQLSLDHTSDKTTLQNLARGSTIFTVTLPIQGAEGAENASGIVTGQLDLLNQTDHTTEDGTPISFRVQGPGDSHDDSDHHIGVPPVVVPAPVIPPTDTGGSVIIVTNSNPPVGDLDIDVHGFLPFEHIDLNLDIPMALASDIKEKIADAFGHFTHHYHFNKDPGKHFIGNIRVSGRNSHKQSSRTVDI